MTTASGPRSVGRPTRADTTASDSSSPASPYLNPTDNLVGRPPRRHSLNPSNTLSSSSCDLLESPPSPFRRASVGGGGASSSSSCSDFELDLDMDGVEQTNEDATLCKKSAVRFGYWRDPYIDQLATKNVERKAPEIHLGYYTRVVGLKRLVDKAMEVMAEKSDKAVQIINFGAGFDTLYWRLKDDLESSGKQDRLKNFVEVDFPGVTARKCHLVKRSKSLLEKVAGEDGEVRLSKTDLHGYDYHIVAADMTNATKLEAKLDECGIDFAAPTIFVAECVLVYISPKTTQEFLTWLTKRFSVTAPLAFIDHEQVNLRDRFGQVMLENLSARGCGLAGAESCKDKDTQTARFDRSGWDGAKCWTMSEAYSMLPPDEVERVERLELFDERELMQQLFDHYCLTVAWREREGASEFPRDDSWLWRTKNSTTTT